MFQIKSNEKHTKSGYLGHVKDPSMCWIVEESLGSNIQRRHSTSPSYCKEGDRNWNNLKLTRDGCVKDFVCRTNCNIGKLIHTHECWAEGGWILDMRLAWGILVVCSHFSEAPLWRWTIWFLPNWKGQGLSRAKWLRIFFLGHSFGHWCSFGDMWQMRRFRLKFWVVGDSCFNF